MIREGRSWSGHERNGCFLNLGNVSEGAQFANVSGISGLDVEDDSRAVSVVDWDHDGDLDLWIRNRTAPRLRFFRNETGRESGYYLELKLVGNGSDTNRDAIGARVEVVLEGESKYKRIKSVRAGESFLSQNSKWLHFGLGETPGEIEKVVVRWPNAANSVETIRGLKPNQRYVVTQGKGWKAPPVRDPTLLAIEPGTVTLPPAISTIRVPAVTLIKAPDIQGRDFSGNRLVTNSFGQFTLLNLWASWCAPCVTELKEFTARADEIKAAGIRVIALSVDGVAGNAGTVESAFGVLKRMAFPFEGGFAQETLLDELKEASDFLVAASEPLSLPMSFLIDPENRITTFYRGELDVDTLIDDASKPIRSRQERWLRSAPYGGRSIDHPHIRETADSLEATIMYRAARRFEEAGNRKLARYYYEQAVQYWPEFSEAQNRLGKLTDH